MQNQITISEMRSIVTSPFYEEMTNEEKSINVNGKPMPKGYYNLICSIRDVNLYSKGIKIHRFFKITDVKKYFGVKGKPTKIAEQLEELREIIVSGDWEKFDVG